MVELDDDEHAQLVKTKSAMTWKEFLLSQKDESTNDRLPDGRNQFGDIKKLGFITAKELEQAVTGVVDSQSQDIAKLRNRVISLNEQVEEACVRIDNLDGAIENNDGALVKAFNRISDLESPNSCPKERQNRIDKNVHHVGGHHQVA